MGLIMGNRMKNRCTITLTALALIISPIIISPAVWAANDIDNIGNLDHRGDFVQNHIGRIVGPLPPVSIGDMHHIVTALIV